MSRLQKKILLAILIFLPVQLGIVGIVGLYKSEPWPAFVFPAFKAVFHTGDYIAFDRPYFYFVMPDGERAPVTDRELFPMIPSSHYNQFFEKQYKPADGNEYRAVDGERKDWYRHQAERLGYPGASSLEVAWLTHRLQFMEDRIVPVEAVPADTLFVLFHE